LRKTPVARISIGIVIAAVVEKAVAWRAGAVPTRGAVTGGQVALALLVLREEEQRVGHIPAV
jgi:hypothetical protein